MNAHVSCPDVAEAERLAARQERRPFGLDGFLDLPNGTRLKVRVRDLSYDGCGIEVPVELAPGQAIKLSVLKRGAIDAEVRWYADGKAGLRFCALAEAPPQRPRHSERIPIVAEVVLRQIGKDKYRVRIFDLSPDGCRVELVDRPRVDDRLFIKFTNLEALQAQVCWVEGSFAGLRFERPIHSAVFDLLLEGMRISSGILDIKKPGKK